MNAGSRFVRQYIPAVTAAVSASWTATTASQNSKSSPSTAKCDPANKKKQQFGFVPDAEGDFHGLFPKRQLWQPKVEYPLWDSNWDGLRPTLTGNEKEDRDRMRRLRKEGVTRHIILVRHGQYDESHKEDEKRLLTPLGRQQADLTGKRLKEMMDGASQEFGPCNIKVVRVSNMARAKETADIIASHLPGVYRSDPDPNINEGRPAHNIPGGRASEGTIEKTDECHSRIEESFRNLFYRAPPPPDDDQDSNKEEGNDKQQQQSKHEFEIVVCHANVIRYFLCRALQIPPEGKKLKARAFWRVSAYTSYQLVYASVTFIDSHPCLSLATISLFFLPTTKKAWLRLCVFNCSMTYLTIRPTGTVSCRMLGDMGHIPYGMSTFSMHAGYNW